MGDGCGVPRVLLIQGYGFVLQKREDSAGTASLVTVPDMWKAEHSPVVPGTQ